MGQTLWHDGALLHTCGFDPELGQVWTEFGLKSVFYGIPEPVTLVSCREGRCVAVTLGGGSMPGGMSRRRVLEVDGVVGERSGAMCASLIAVVGGGVFPL